MLPRGDRAYTEREKWLFTHVPLLARLYRWWIWLALEMRFPLFRGNRTFARIVRQVAEKNITDNVADPHLRQILLPDYPVGGKRILISDDYYAALGRNNVEVVTSPIDHLTQDAVLTRDGVAHPADVLIFATGFQSTAFLTPMHVEGCAGKRLETEWADGARAYRGLAITGFPNFFLMYGPNTNLGHNSIIFMIECQTRYILGAIRTLLADDLACLDVRKEDQDAYDSEMQKELARTVWAETGKSWYKTEAGRITNNWSGSTIRYWWTTRRFDREHYRAVARMSAERGRSDESAAIDAGLAAR